MYRQNSILYILSRINLSQNDRERLVLPYIQRDFIWPEEKILDLLDSVVRGYPIGTVLFWETKKEMKYRDFQKFFPFKSNFMTKSENIPVTIVLDGQQRLQSLYFSCFGSVNGKEVYFNILSQNNFVGLLNNTTTSEKEISYSDTIYEFKFLNNDEVDELNNQSAIFVKLKNILFSSIHDIESLKNNIRNKYNLEQNSFTLMSTNISLLKDGFTKTEYFSYYTIDNQILNDSSAKSVSEVLEIFFRVNTKGEPLSKSELMFSLLKSEWGEAFETFEKLLLDFNESDKFNLDNDYIIKSLLTIHTLQSRFNYERLNKKLISDFMKDESIEKFKNSLVYLKSFLTETCLLRCETVFNRSYNTFIPILYYIYKHPNNIIPESEFRKVRFFIYASLIKKYISRYTDSRVPKLLKEYFNKLKDKPDYFPLEESISYLETREGKFDLDDDLIYNSNISVIMNIIYNGIILPPYEKRVHKDLDHIFPKSKLEKYDNKLINNYANFRYVNNIINKIKSNEEPLSYFTSLSENELLQEHLINKNLLTNDKYQEFIADRQNLIKNKVKDFLKY